MEYIKYYFKALLKLIWWKTQSWPFSIYVTGIKRSGKTSLIRTITEYIKYYDYTSIIDGRDLFTFNEMDSQEIVTKIENDEPIIIIVVVDICKEDSFVETKKIIC